MLYAADAFHAFFARCRLFFFSLAVSIFLISYAEQIFCFRHAAATLLRPLRHHRCRRACHRILRATLLMMP